MSQELEDLLNSSYKLRKALEQLFNKEAVDYFMELVSKDCAHRKFLKIVEENET